MVAKNLINHFSILLDASSSMESRKTKLIEVVDNYIKYLAQRSTHHDQETRVTIYSFADKVECLVYDKDVLRLPSIASLYNVYGWTALRDATYTAILDQRLIPQKYGDHAFLTSVFTDGLENKSKLYDTYQLSTLLKGLADNETVSALVPDQESVFEAKRFGFPANNISVWNANKADGVSEAVDVLRSATDNFMTARTTGTRSTTSLFSMGSDVLNKQTVQANLTPLNSNAYILTPVVGGKDDKIILRDYVQGLGKKFEIGKAYYQLSKTEKVQPHKNVAVMDKQTKKLYSGPQARQILGLQDKEERVKPEANPEFHVFIQSTSWNRHLVVGTQLLLVN